MLRFDGFIMVGQRSASGQAACCMAGGKIFGCFCPCFVINRKRLVTEQPGMSAGRAKTATCSQKLLRIDILQVSAIQRRLVEIYRWMCACRAKVALCSVIGWSRESLIDPFTGCIAAGAQVATGSAFSLPTFLTAFP
jgi:hypothetical protein